MPPRPRSTLRVVRAVLLGALVATGCSTRPAIAPIDALPATSFGPELVDKGAQLAAVGNCFTCHTARDGKPYAGGYPVRTPFGVVYGTNITPDPDTGLGHWSEEAFRRALREGVDRAGRHLYPAFPHDHFTRLRDDDIRALYAYFMTREPVRAETPAPTVMMPRPLVAVWKALYFRQGPSADDASTSPVERGRYLADALAHCGACHTPRNGLGAEKPERAYDGGEAGGWHAPALNAASTSPVPWTAEAMSDGAPDTGAGALLYAGMCAQCHDRGRAVDGGALQLPLAIAPTLPTPLNLIRIIRDGIVPHADERSAWMPPFANDLTDTQLADLIAYIRTFSGMPPWPDVSAAVAAAKKNET